MKNRHFATLMILAFTLLVSAGSYSQSLKPHDSMSGKDRYNLGLPDDTFRQIQDVLETRSLPDVKSVTLKPEAPGAGEPVEVTAEIFMHPRSAGDEVSEASILFTIDGGASWQSAPMEQDKENYKIWTGEIPGQPAGAKVLYGIKAINFSGNSYVEAVCETEKSPISADGYVEGDCIHKQNLKECKSDLPRNCMFPMSMTMPEYADDEETSRIPEDLDLREARIGFNKDNIFMDVAVKGKISPGMISPMNVNIYVAGGINPDRPAFGDGIESFMTQGAAIIYIPLDSQHPCSVHFMKVDHLEIDNNSSACTVKDNHLLFTMKRVVTLPNPSNTLEFMLIDLMQTSILPHVMSLLDFTHFTRARMESRSYIVK